MVTQTAAGMALVLVQKNNQVTAEALVILLVKSWALAKELMKG